jgi:hypothetical protein
LDPDNGERLYEKRRRLAKLFLQVGHSVRLMFKNHDHEECEGCRLVLRHPGALLQGIERVAPPDLMDKPLEPRGLQFGKRNMHSEEGGART